jgi:hypothetical protein
MSLNFTLRGVVLSETIDLPLFKHAQEVRLHVERHLAELVQKERAAVGGLDLADHAAAPRAGEGSFGVPEQLGCEQFAGQTAAVDHDEWGRLRTAAVMDALGEDFLPDPRFAQQ